ncbi:bile acid:sodium symporter [Methylophaga sp. 42_25_T18]|nr:bile acid:sodium symporter [Methylophaga sp. 42_25_T18]OUR86047.1 bile acid:sodium symporter [Methylophaga sp. 42_8_T64]
MAFSWVAYLLPEIFIDFKPVIIPLLSVIMFTMGMTLSLDDFKRVLQAPKVIGLGVILQYGLMPLFAFIIAKVLHLPLELMVGLILVGACPGGTASNVMCFLSRGDVALSISLTAVSTILAVVLTPFITWLYIGQEVVVPIVSMMLTVFKIILLPVFLGVVINRYLGVALQPIKPFLPLFAMAAIILIIAIIVALNVQQLSQIALAITIAIMLHNSLGLLSGYWLAKALGYDERVCRTLAIEVGMQNSGLGVALATKYFSAMVALPSALFSIWHNLSGSLLASYWLSKKTNTKD